MIDKQMWNAMSTDQKLRYSLQHVKLPLNDVCRAGINALLRKQHMENAHETIH